MRVCPSMCENIYIYICIYLLGTPPQKKEKEICDESGSKSYKKIY